MTRTPRGLTHRVGNTDRKTAAQAAATRRAEHLAAHGPAVAAEHAERKAARNAAAMRRIHVAAVRDTIDEADTYADDLAYASESYAAVYVLTAVILDGYGAQIEALNVLTNDALATRAAA